MGLHKPMGDISVAISIFYSSLKRATSTQVILKKGFSVFISSMKNAKEVLSRTS